MRRSLGAVVVASVVLAASGGAFAQRDPTARARARFADGVRLYEQGQYTPALDAFREAYQIRPHPSVLVNMANCYMQLDRPREATRQFEQYLAEAGATLEPAQRTDIERALGDARLAVAHLRVDAQPEGVQVFLDGDRVGRSPLPRDIDVNPGPHVVEVRDARGLTASRRFRAARGETTHLAIRVGDTATEAVEPAVIDTERPAITTHTETTTTTSGARDRWHPPEPEEPPAGHRSTHPAPAHDTAAQAAEPQAEVPSDRTDRGFFARVPTASWVTAGAGAALVAVGVGFGVAALGQQSDFDSVARRIQTHDYASEEQLADLQDRGQSLHDAQQRNALVSDVTLALGLASIGTAVVVFIVSDGDSTRAGGSRPTSPPRVLAGPLPGGAMLGVVGEL